MQKLTSAIKTATHQAYLLPIACIAVFLAACSTPGPTLNSERIAQAFGSYGVDVLQSGDELRVASLYSGSGDEKVTRTFAVVTFAGRISPALAREHAAVLSGESLGAVFKAAGWAIEKHNVFVGQLALSEEHAMVGELMQIRLPAELAAHVYLFVVSKDNRSYNYATIVELHHPEYLSLEDLRELYGEMLFDDSNRTSIDHFIDPDLWQN